MQVSSAKKRIAIVLAAMAAVLVVFGAPTTAFAAGLPVVTTGTATISGDTGATLKGTVNPNGLAATYQFEYGPTTAYGSLVPVVPASVGSGSSPVAVSNAVNGLVSSTKYHFRVVATNSEGTSKSTDGTFTTGTTSIPTALLGMKTTEPFDGSAGSLSNFSANWAALGWAAGKGEDSATGWHPTAESPTVNGAYLNQTLADAGQGLGVQATMAASPGASPRYFSVWLDMSNPAAATRSGYELRFAPLGGSYTAQLIKWVSGTGTLLGSKPEVSLAAGEGIALTDKGSSVQAWIRGASTATNIITATDSVFSSGRAGVEGVGNAVRLTNFKVGTLLTPVANITAALNALTIRDGFGTIESPLSLGGAFGALAWDNSPSGHNTGQVYSGGWGPSDAFPTVNGAYWTVAPFADTGGGEAIAFRLMPYSGGSGQYYSLWLDMPSPGTAKTGYEMRFKSVGSETQLSVTRWQAGVATSLGSINVVTGFGLQLAFVDKGSKLSYYLGNGEGSWGEFWSVTDSAFNGGYAGMEASGGVRMRDLQAGSLAPF